MMNKILEVAAAVELLALRLGVLVLMLAALAEFVRGAIGL